jgi:hypothetical protein
MRKEAKSAGIFTNPLTGQDTDKKEELVPKKPRDRDGSYTCPDRPGFWGSWTDSSGRRRMFKSRTFTRSRVLLAAEEAAGERTLTMGNVPPTKATSESMRARYSKHERARHEKDIVAELKKGAHAKS